MTRLYTCNLILAVPVRGVPALIEKAVDCIKFAPATMDVFFNEFKAAEHRVPFDRIKLINSISQFDGDGGITSVALYDAASTPKRPTPFFRARIDLTLSGEYPILTLEWVAHESVDYLIDDHCVIRLFVGGHAEILSCIAFDQDDAFEQSQAQDQRTTLQKLLRTDYWGRSETVFGMTFIAAPIMIFGEGFEQVIPRASLLKSDKARTLKIAGKTFVEVTLTDLYGAPAQGRAAQQAFWKTVSLAKCIRTYRESEKRDFGALLKQRAATFEAAKARKG